ncbi:hypothetical protein D1007_21506 [Hordeum vulgare]|nr:hypothetical protein D1007_21506 [Hordeum vulgare]
MSQPAAAKERLKVYLRICPLPASEMERGGRPAGGHAKAKEQPPSPEMERGGRPTGGRAKAKEQLPSPEMKRGSSPAGGRAKAKETPPSPELKRGSRPAGGRAKAKEQPPTGICLVATGPSSVVLVVPQAKLGNHTRGRTIAVPRAARFLPDP